MIAAASLPAWMAIGRLVGDHLWQSTLFAAAAGLLTLAMRGNRAHVRHGIWLAASIKFLVPFAALVAIGSRFQWRTVPIAQPEVTFVINAMSQPFSGSELDTVVSLPQAAPALGAASVWALLVTAVWLAGSAAISFAWWRKWRRVAMAVHLGSPVNEGRELEMLRRLEHIGGIKEPTALVRSNEPIEPGVFGIIRPTLLWPRGIGEHLTDGQLEAILAHEVSHICRRDNLAAAVHMLVEAAFWFHPLVWWLGARLVDERERACDEEVVRLGHEPFTYAESILKICQFCLESPLTCIAGVTGSDLKKRLEQITRNETAPALTSLRRALLVAAGVSVMAGPVIVGASRATLRAVSSQSGAAPRAFAAATIKPNVNPGAGNTGGCRGIDSRLGSPLLSFRPRINAPSALVPLGRCVIVGARLDTLISIAFDIPLKRIDGLQRIPGFQSWGATRFNIEAVAEDPATTTEQQLLSMLQQFLTDQFRLGVNRETKDGPTFSLVVAKNGPKNLHPSKADGQGMLPQGTSLVFKDFSIQDLAEFFSMLPLVQRPVKDMTGLHGRFDFSLEVLASPTGDPIEAKMAMSRWDTIFSDVQQQLGLRFEPSTGPIETLIIDHAERLRDDRTESRRPESDPAQAPPRPQAARWLMDETDHFNMFYEPSVASRLELVKREVERAYNMVSADLHHDIPSRQAIIVFAARVELARASSVDELAAIVGALPPADQRVLVAVDMSPEQRSTELVRQLRTIFERDISRSKTREQTAASASLESAPIFEVASVKVNKSVDTRRGGVLQPGRLSQTNVTLLQLIHLTYSGQVVGGPSWVGVERFDVEAKGDFDMSGFLPASDGSHGPVAYLMLRSLLAERFKLKVHDEMRELPVYALKIARSDGEFGPQFRRADVDCEAVMAAIAKNGRLPAPPERGKAPTCGSAARPGQIISNGVSMPRFAGMLSQFANRPVVDRTNLSGDFILQLQWTPDESLKPDASGLNSSPPPGDSLSIFTALQEQLGLKLESTKGPVDVLVIDQAERPSEN